MKKQIFILAGVVAFVMGFFLITRNSSTNSGTLFETDTKALEASTIDYENDIETAEISMKESISNLHRTVFVDVQGEVISPGVFEVDHSVRVGYLIDLAGGLTDYACINGLNRAARIYDEMVILVPHIDNVSGSTTEKGGLDTSSVEDSDLISINTASALELQSLPGIGPVLSENIVTHRTENGAFSTIDELINVSGIGAGIMENVREYIKP